MKTSMNLKRMSLSVLASAMLLTACNKESDNISQTGEETNVSVRMTTGANPESRAQGVGVADNTPLSFLNGYIYFVDGSQITNRVQIITSGTPDNETTVHYDDLIDGSGATLKNIKSNATHVHFIGNVPASVTLPASGNMTAVWSQMAGIQTQADATGGVVNASLYGTGTVDPPSGLPTDPKEVQFNAYAVVSRIQIPFLEINNDPENVVTGFQLDGIFINNFHHSAPLNGVAPASSLITYSDNSNWAPDGETYYGTSPVNYTGVTFDFAASGGLGGFDAIDTEKYYPDPADHNELWAYNLFAGGSAPRVILKLSNITTSDGSTFSNPQYITIKGINNGSTLTTLTGGMIYTFAGGIPIHSKHMTSTPEVEAIEVHCDISLIPWKDETVTPEF